MQIPGKHLRRLLFLWGWVLGLMGIAGCAYKVAPGGGPEDKSPPEVVFSFPQPDSTGVQDLSTIELRFNEAVNPASFLDQVWIIPRIEEGFTLQWKGGKRLRIHLLEPLKEDQTYVLILGTGVQDLRGNGLKEPFVLAFSTGSRIDRGIIRGRVYGRRARNAFIFAYPDWWGPDSLPFFSRQAPYFTQPGEKGNFELRYLKHSSYLVVAVEDQDGDGKYSPMRDRIGFPPFRVVVDSVRPAAPPIYFYFIREDTLAPRMLRVDTLHRRLLKLIFSKSIVLEKNAGARIIDSLSGKPLSLRYMDRNPQQSRELLLYTDPQQARIYRAEVWGVQDSLGRRVEGDTVFFRFRGSVQGDTTTPRILKRVPRDGEQQVPYRTSIQLLFNLPVDTFSLQQAFRLLDEDSVPVAGTWDCSSWLVPRFHPEKQLKKNTRYTIRLDLHALRTIFGRAFGDSLQVGSFRTWDWADLGEIEGTLDMPDSLMPYPVWIEVHPLNRESVLDRVMAREGRFFIPFLPDGRYRLRVFVDRNRNRRLDLGGSRPFRFAEPFFWVPDTIQVRKRWTTQGIEVRWR